MNLYNQQMSILWTYIDKTNKIIVLNPRDSNDIEEEYQSHLNDIREGQRVYHCFGTGSTACINFDQMRTNCGSTRCRLAHTRNNLPNDHMTYQLKRITKIPSKD